MFAEAVWVDIHSGKPPGDYRSGLRFVQISSDDLDKLKTFLKSLAE
jgi:hypothetical protein